MPQTQQDYNYSLQEVLDLLIKRDMEDAEISKSNSLELIKKGLNKVEPKRKLTIDTGIVVGIENVINHIKNSLNDDDQIIALEGLSGVGKSSTAKALQRELQAASFSFGEIFRYLAYMKYKKQINDHKKVLEEVEYGLLDNALCLYCGNENLTHKLVKDLTEPNLVSLVPNVSAVTQDIAINFVSKEISRLKAVYDRRIIIEGRDFTLDFLPCDIRIELYADPMIRAKRRFHQDID